MAIKITDNFQVNIKNPIDNRFVVGSQSIPGGPGSIYPTPFYAYRDDISSNMGFVYPGLRIWDFNDNLPYVWTGTTWSNENLTGASVLNSGDPGFSAGNGYRNYVTKFYDTGTVLTKSLLFDNNIHVGLGITSSIDPNKSGGAGVPPLNSSSPSNGLHVSGRIRTNTGFVGYGGYIHSINAQNIDAGPSNTGRLQLPLIATPGVTSPTTTYVLTSQINPVTLNILNSWQDILNVAPLYSPTNLGTTNPGAVSLYSGTVGLNHEFFSLVSSGLQIDPGSAGGGSVRIESRPGSILGGGSASVYKQLNPSTKVHEFKTISSNFMDITEANDIINLNSNITSSTLQVSQNPNDPHGIIIEIPASFEGTDYYVNGLYQGQEQLGTRSKPFKSLKACINKILNRSSVTIGVTPDTYDPTINRPNIYNPVTKASTQDITQNGVAFKKWEVRTGPGQPKATYRNNYYSNLPGVGAARVIIQSYTEIDENLAINGVTYFLEKGGYSSMIVVPQGATTYNAPGTPENTQPFEYLFDMKLLTDSVDRGNPKRYDYDYRPWDPASVLGFDPDSTAGPLGNKPGELDYPLRCYIEGQGTIGFGGEYTNTSNVLIGGHSTRKGYVRAKGTNSRDYYLSGGLQPTYFPPSSPPPTPIGQTNWWSDTQHTSEFSLGSPGGYISLQMYRNYAVRPAHITTVAPYTPGQNSGDILKNEDDIAITREGVVMEGYKTTAVPDYGAIQVEGRNLMFYESFTFNGTVVITCDEQHMIYAKDYGTLYSDNGRVYMRRNYQKVLYSKSEFNTTNLQAGDTNNLTAGAWYKITVVGTTLLAQWKLIAQPSTWRNITGDPIPEPPIGTIVSTLLNYSFKTRTTPPGGLPFGSGRVTSARKLYLPCDHVYDIYLKNGGQFNHGGDFYTQQNTSAMQGGPCSFVCVENNIISAGDTMHPLGTNNQSSTMCYFSANGGGFVTNLFYNYFIKHIYDTSYSTVANYDGYNKHGITFKSVKIDSYAYKSISSVVHTSGATYPTYLTNSPATSGTSFWNFSGKAIGLGTFRSCLLYDKKQYCDLRVPFSDTTIQNGTNTGLLYIAGTPIDLSSSYMSPLLPSFANDADAAISNLPVGAVYRLYNTTSPNGNIRMRTS